MGNPITVGSLIHLCTPPKLTHRRVRTSGRASELKYSALDSGMPVYLITALYLILPNLPLLLSSHVLGGFPRGYVSLEFLLIGALSSFLRRSVVFALLWFELLADFTYSVCNAYQFTLVDLLSSLRYVPALPALRVYEGLAIVALGFLLCVALAFVRPPQQQRTWTTGVILGCAVILILVDIICGQSPIWHKDVALISYRVARTSIATLAVHEIQSHFSGKKSHLGVDTPAIAASDSATSFLDDHQGAMESPNVVLVVVESWGIPIDSDLGRALAAPYDDPRVLLKYDVSSGVVPFTGHTVPGEARELCRSSIGFGILSTPPDLVKHCLPAFFHARGYQNYAVHGFLGEMFSRSNWYPGLGFDRSWFGPELHRMGLPNCPGSFPGICDGAIGGWIGRELLSKEEGKPKFIYWVTLNSHLIEPEHPDLPDDGVCTTQPALTKSAALCSWFRLVRAVHQSVELTALATTARPTVFVIVGDHAPPFGNPQLRADFSSSMVPYEMLTPKESTPH
jgi:Sulfatase